MEDVTIPVPNPVNCCLFLLPFLHWWFLCSLMQCHVSLTSLAFSVTALFLRFFFSSFLMKNVLKKCFWIPLDLSSDLCKYINIGLIQVKKKNNKWRDAFLDVHFMHKIMSGIYSYEKLACYPNSEHSLLYFIRKEFKWIGNWFFFLTISLQWTTNPCCTTLEIRPLSLISLTSFGLLEATW